MYFALLFYVLVYLTAQNGFVEADCGVVSRKDWGGLSVRHVEYLPRPVKLVIIQHTVTPTCNTDNRCVELVRSIQRQHVENLKYWDIGASFYIGDNGKVYEGPGWLHVGAHTYGYNKKSIGISFIGNFNNDEPTLQALEAAKALVRCGVERGHLKPEYSLVAHRQLIATESPGLKLYNSIRSWPDWTENVDAIKNKS